MNVQKIAAFSSGETGGNPAGVVICAELPSSAERQCVAAEVGFSETVFAAPHENAWQVRYFAPELEVPFCGHATIALGAALALHRGDGVYSLLLRETDITVEGRRDGEIISAALQSPPTYSRSADPELVTSALKLFALSREDLDERIPPAFAHGGANHLVLALRSRKRLREMHYDLSAGKALMLGNNVVTICLVYVENRQLFHVRNPFASGGIYEDPATGAAAAAFGGYLRDLGWNYDGHINIAQGEDMGIPSRIRVEIPPARGQSVRVSGTARLMSRSTS
jgi:PhzF family phenazine biosynthesis protein